MHRVEHNRREDGAAFRAYFDGTADALFVHDETGDIVDVNREACESLGYSRQELIGRSLRDVDANGGVPGSFAAGGGASADADEMRCFETSHRRKDGSVFPVEVRVRPFSEGGRRLAIWSARDLVQRPQREGAGRELPERAREPRELATDVEDRQRAEQALRVSEERFRTLVQFSFDVYWETDAQHRFTTQEFGEHVKDAPVRGSELGKTRWEVPYLEPGEEAWLEHRATLDAHLPFRDFELARPTGDGSKRYVSVSGFPVFDDAGAFIGYRGVGRHVTDRKRAEEEHRAYLWFLESMDRINRAIQGTHDLDRMISDVLHAALEIFACDRAWLVYPCDPDAPSWHAVMERTRPEYPGAFALGTKFPIDADVAAVFAAALAAPGAVLSGDGHSLRIPPRLAEQFVIRSQIAMAIDANTDKAYLFGLHQCSREREWTAQEQRLLQEVGRRFGDALTSLRTLRRLRDSEQKLQVAQQIAHVGWWERDLTTNEVSLSEEVQRIFGVEAVDLSPWQDRWVNLIHPDDRAQAAAAAAAALHGGPRYDVEYRVIRPDGSVRVVHCQGDVSRDESGRPLRQFGVLQDITERKQSQDELAEIKERFRVLAESSITGIYVTHLDRFSYVNPAFARMFGYAADEIIDRLGSLDLTCPADRPLVAQNMRRRLEGEVEELRYEFRGLRKDGSLFPIEVHGRRIEYGGRIGVLGTLIDNTERKRAEDELRASEARFRTFVDHARDAFYLTDEALTVVDVNREACESLGYSRDELIGMHPRDFDAGLDESSIGRLAERAREGETITFETLHRRADGSVFPVEIRAHAFEQRGERFYLALVRDISERKRAEEELRATEDRYRTLVEFAADAFMLHDERGRVIDVNRQACENLGYARTELIGMMPAQFDEGLDPVTLRRVSERVAAGETITIETRHRRKDGTLFPVEVRVRQVRQGERFIAISLSRDITERKRGEDERERLRRLEADLALMSRVITMGELTASIAHEVNQPLGAMVANAAACERWLAAKPAQTTKARQALKSISADGQRASAIIGRIRALMKRQPPRKETLDINEAIREVLALARARLRNSDVVLRLDEALPSIDGDKVQLQQVLLNLIANAIDAMSAIEGRQRALEIVSRRDAASVVVEVRDTGIGLSAERAEQLFEAFYTTKQEGMGIGLAISRSIVEAHGGHLWAGPNQPYGAVFAFSLPVADRGQA